MKYLNQIGAQEMENSILEVNCILQSIKINSEYGE